MKRHIKVGNSEYNEKSLRRAYDNGRIDEDTVILCDGIMTRLGDSELFRNWEDDSAQSGDDEDATNIEIIEIPKPIDTSVEPQSSSVLTPPRKDRISSRLNQLFFARITVLLPKRKREVFEYNRKKIAIACAILVVLLFASFLPRIWRFTDRLFVDKNEAVCATATQYQIYANAWEHETLPLIDSVKRRLSQQIEREKTIIVDQEEKGIMGKALDKADEAIGKVVESGERETVVYIKLGQAAQYTQEYYENITAINRQLDLSTLPPDFLDAWRTCVVEVDNLNDELHKLTSLKATEFVGTLKANWKFRSRLNDNDEDDPISAAIKNVEKANRQAFSVAERYGFDP